MTDIILYVFILYFRYEAILVWFSLSVPRAILLEKLSSYRRKTMSPRRAFGLLGDSSKLRQLYPQQQNVSCAKT